MELDHILQGCLQGDPRAQRALYECYSPVFYALCLRYTGDADAARDVLVEGFTSIFRHIEDYRGDSSLETWMHRIMVRRACLHVRRREASPVVASAKWVDPGDRHDVEEQFLLREAFKDGLRRLDDKQRLVFNLVAVEGYFFTDLPDLVGIPVHTAKRIYAKAKKIMKETLIEHEIAL